MIETNKIIPNCCNCYFYLVDDNECGLVSRECKNGNQFVKLIIKPDGTHELDLCLYKTIATLTVDDMEVYVEECTNCGKKGVSWIKK